MGLALGLPAHQLLEGLHSFRGAGRRFELKATEHGIRIIDVSYGDAMAMGTNVVALGGERVLVPSTSKRLAEACRAEGLTVYDPDVSMIAAGGGAVHCMCQALRRDHA